MEDYLKFKKMITPVFIQVLFWLGVAGVVIAGFATMFQGSYWVLAGLFQLVLGVISVRVGCEILIVLFRMYECLEAIREVQAPSEKAAPEGE